MNTGLYHQLNQIEDVHWWHIARRNLIEKVLSPLDFKEKGRGLDVGCGIGGNLDLLGKYCGEVIGFDYSPTALDLAKEKRPEHQFIEGDANQLTDYFKAEQFSLVTLFNVLYHQWIKDETDVLKQIYSILAPGGYVVLTEPAFKSLMRKHDHQGMGKTRYRRGEFKVKLTEAGFRVRKASYFNSFSFLPAYLLKSFEWFSLNAPQTQKDHVGELSIPHPILNNSLIAMMKLETQIIKSVGSVPFGLTLLCVAQKDGLN